VILDQLVHPPQIGGAYPYNAYGPHVPGFIGRGQSFVDPVFLSTVRRLTAEYPAASASDLYAKNGFWNSAHPAVADQPVRRVHLARDRRVPGGDHVASSYRQPVGGPVTACVVHVLDAERFRLSRASGEHLHLPPVDRWDARFVDAPNEILQGGRDLRRVHGV